MIKAEHELVDVIESRYGPGELGPAPHVHRKHADGFYVLDGEFVFQLGPEGERVDARAGTAVLAPAGVVHGFDHEGAADGRLLNFHAPSMGFAESLRARRDPSSYDPARFDTFAPPQDGGRPVSDAVVRRLGEGESITVGGSDVLFKVEAGDGDGTFSLTEFTVPPGFPGPLPHRHERHLDSFYVLAGILRLRVGDETFEALAGSYGFVPPGSVHTFSNPGSRTVRALNLMAPAGFEQYLKEVALVVPPGAPPDPRAMAEIASRYDFHPVR